MGDFRANIAGFLAVNALWMSSLGAVASANTAHCLFVPTTRLSLLASLNQISSIGKPRKYKKYSHYINRDYKSGRNLSASILPRPTSNEEEISTFHQPDDSESTWTSIEVKRADFGRSSFTLYNEKDSLEEESTVLLDADASDLSVKMKARQINDIFTATGMVLLLSLAVESLIKFSPEGSWRYYLAGGICASSSHAISTPIDVVKTRQQVDPWLQEKSMWQATLEIVKTGGPFSLLAGLGPTFIGYLLEGGVKFGIYEVSKPVTQRFVGWLGAFFSNPALDSRFLSLILCGSISGFAASLFLSPMEALRVRIVSDSEFSDKNWMDAGVLMVKKEGMQGLLKGFPAMLWKQVPYTITKNASFDLLTSWLYGIWRAMGYAITDNAKFSIPLLSAIIAAVLSCISSHPGDVLLSLVNAHEGSKRTKDFATDILRGKDGVRGFFVGFKARSLHVLLIVTVQLMIYDFVKRLVGIAPTGMG